MQMPIRILTALLMTLTFSLGHAEDSVQVKATADQAVQNEPANAQNSQQESALEKAQTTQDTVAKNVNVSGQNKTPLAKSPRGVLQLDETVISGNQELPKVLYILPWREPQGLPQIEIQAEFTEAEVFRRLYPPAYRRELSYFETLRGLKDDVGPNQEE